MNNRTVPAPTPRPPTPKHTHTNLEELLVEVAEEEKVEDKEAADAEELVAVRLLGGLGEVRLRLGEEDAELQGKLGAKHAVARDAHAGGEVVKGLVDAVLEEHAVEQLALEQENPLLKGLQLFGLEAKERRVGAHRLHHALVEGPVLVQRLVRADELVERDEHGERLAERGKHGRQVHLGHVDALRRLGARVHGGQLLHRVLDDQRHARGEHGQGLQRRQHARHLHLAVAVARHVLGEALAVQRERRVKLGLGLGLERLHLEAQRRKDAQHLVEHLVVRLDELKEAQLLVAHHLPSPPGRRPCQRAGPRCGYAG